MFRQYRSILLDTGALLFLLVCWGCGPVASILVSSPAEVHAVGGDDVSLSCSFRSSSRTTSRMSVDWAYRPQSGGPPRTFFHFSSLAYPPTEGRFKGRVRWEGAPARGHAHIALLNASLADNGTFTCSVRNPPDVHGSPTSHTVLTVTPRVEAVRFSDVAVLLVFVLLPSALISLVLIGRMFCPPRDPGQSQPYHSSIEVTDGDEHGLKPTTTKEKNLTCCDLYILDTDQADYYVNKETPPREEEEEEEGVAESRC